ncbi:MAG: hypothetical protein AAFQ85_05550 [Pseudomonadota bacterium]
MGKDTLRWGQDVGYTDRIKPLTPKTALAAHGVTGDAQSGDLGFSRAMTKREAKRDAADGIPPSDAADETQWSEREQLISEKAEDVRRGVTSWFRATGGEVRNYIQDLTPAPVNDALLQEAIKSEENELRHFETDDAAQARLDHEQAARELEEFRDRNKHAIGERTPDIKVNVEQTIAVLIAVMILEGGFNALLFKDAQASGLLGGVLVAFGVSAVNVAFGVVAGFFGLRYAMNHSELPMRIMGGAVATVFVVMGLFLNFFVAHFRDAVEAGLHAEGASGLAAFSMFAIPPGQVIAGMFPNLFGLSSLVAFGLLFIGLAVFAVALYEGYDKLSDRYPGYGRVWRKERKAYEMRQLVRNGLRDDLSDYFTRSRAWFDDQQTRHVAAKREIEKAITLLEARREEAMAVAAKAGDQERGLKIAYRQSHRKMRNALRDTLGDEARIPAYFDDIVTPTMPELEYQAERDLANETISSVDRNISQLNACRRWLEEHIQDSQERLKSVDRMDAGEPGSNDARARQKVLADAAPEIKKPSKAAAA